MLKGENVILRAIEREDLKRLHELQKNVDLILLGAGHWAPVPLAQFEKDFDKNLERQEKTWFAIEVEAKVIGEIGLTRLNRRDSNAALAIGIYDPAYVGKGYGRNAIKVLLDWCFRIQNLQRIWLDTLATNERAIRAYRACGFVEEGCARQAAFYDGGYVDVVMMGLLRSEWETRDSDKNPDQAVDSRHA